MIAEVDGLLTQWAAWRLAPDAEVRAGFSSTIHRMMTSNAAKRRQDRFRKSRRMIRVGDDEKGALVERHIEPMRAVETRRDWRQHYASDTAAELLDQAIANMSLQHRRWREAIECKYIQELPDHAGAAILKCSNGQYKNWINFAHAFLHGWLRSIVHINQWGSNMAHRP